MTRFISAVIVFLAVAVTINASFLYALYQAESQADGIPKYTWFECGLLYEYGIDKFMSILDQFRFDGVLVQPFMLDAGGEQTLICDDFATLCDSLDAYEESHRGFQKFLFVGSHGHLDKTLVALYARRGYVMCIDDGVTNFTLLWNHLMFIKSYGVETGLVHWQMSDVYRTLFQEEGLVDYSLTCFYPHHPNGDYDQCIADFREMRRWCGDAVKFVPAIQVFGGTPVRWRFPNPNQIEEMKVFLGDLNPAAVVWFQPWSGESLRGETFEGFLDHPEIWDFIR